jgi:hypothetical protein
MAPARSSTGGVPWYCGQCGQWHSGRAQRHTASDLPILIVSDMDVPMWRGKFVSAVANGMLVCVKVLGTARSR